MKQCPVCEEGSLSLEQHIRTETIGDKECEIPLWYWLCDTCGSEQSDDKLAHINRKSLLEIKERENYIDRIYGVMCKADRPNNRSDMAEALYDAGLRFVEE